MRYIAPPTATVFAMVRNVVLIAAHQHVSETNLCVTAPSATEAAERRVRSIIKPLFGDDAHIQTQIIISPNTKEGTDSALLAQLVELMTCNNPPATAVGTKLKPVEKRAYGLPLTEEEESRAKGRFTCFTTREKMLDIVLVSQDVHLLNAAVTLFAVQKLLKTLHLVLFATQTLVQNTAARVESMVREVPPNTNIFFYSFGAFADEYTPASLYTRAFPSTPKFMTDVMAADRAMRHKTGPYETLEIKDLYVRSRTANNTIAVLKSFALLAPERPIVVLWDNDAYMKFKGYGGVSAQTLRAYGKAFDEKHDLAAGSATVALLQAHPTELKNPLTIPPLFDACV